ncbi:hypothetical protein H8356DRAFT_1423580 [Neocallimastix lanati (nom. inval.)]|nr:hypothetical protein H8356DRAFT_1423580 [Neocallimastix sp. JGI-2020a]
MTVFTRESQVRMYIIIRKDTVLTPPSSDIHIIITLYKYYDDFIYEYNNDTIINKQDLLNVRNEYPIGYYCKKDICIKADLDYIILYIVQTYSYEYVKLGYYDDKVRKTYIENTTHVIYITCSQDSVFLSNKCFNNYCVFNEENPFVRCYNIYLNNSYHIYCGKASFDTCKNNNEYSSKNCSTDGLCQMQLNEPQINDSLDSKNFSMMVICRSIMYGIIILKMITWNLMKLLFQGTHDSIYEQLAHEIRYLNIRPAVDEDKTEDEHVPDSIQNRKLRIGEALREKSINTEHSVRQSRRDNICLYGLK